MKPIFTHFPDNSSDTGHYIYTPSRPLGGYYTYYGSDTIYRPTYEDHFGSSSSRNPYYASLPIEQQGVHSSQTKIVVMFPNNQDTDMRDILDTSSCLPALDVIKFLSEYPL